MPHGGQHWAQEWDCNMNTNNCMCQCGSGAISVATGQYIENYSGWREVSELFCRALTDCQDGCQNWCGRQSMRGRQPVRGRQPMKGRPTRRRGYNKGGKVNTSNKSRFAGRSQSNSKGKFNK